MKYTATYFLEMSARFSLKVATNDLFRVKTPLKIGNSDFKEKRWSAIKVIYAFLII